MTLTPEEREKTLEALRTAGSGWKGPWCSSGGFWVRHIFKDGILIREVYRARPEEGGIYYHELPE